jgi:electron transfer flavoprotein alpha/beta subunit
LGSSNVVSTQELVVVSVGPSNAIQQLHTTLAMGADRGILVEHPEDLEPFSIAKIFHKLCEIEKPDLVILGKQAVDDDSNQVITSPPQQIEFNTSIIQQIHLQLTH